MECAGECSREQSGDEIGFGLGGAVGVHWSAGLSNGPVFVSGSPRG